VYCSYAKKIKEILMSLNNKQKSLCQMVTTQLYKGCGSGSFSAEARKFYRFHIDFDLKINLAKMFCPFPDVD